MAQNLEKKKKYIFVQEIVSQNQLSMYLPFYFIPHNLHWESSE